MKTASDFMGFTRAGPLAKKTARLIEKETFGNSDAVGFTITPTSLEFAETTARQSRNQIIL
jgi:hypothetical protein